MKKLWRRIYFLLHRRRFERELADEIEAHREMMPPERQTHFGNATRLSELSREAWSWNWLEQGIQDLAYGTRVLLRAPVFTLGAVGVLALGVGANLAEFQIFDAMIFHRFHFRDADTCLQFAHTSREGQRLGFPSGAVDSYRTQSHSFSWLIAEDTSAEVALDGDTGLRSVLVTSNYFASLGLLPSLGRLLDARDAQPGAPPVAVLSYAYWQTRWAGDPAVAGRTLRVNDLPVQIAGVLPASFEGLMARGAVVWFPDSMRSLLLPGTAPLQQDFLRASQALYGKVRAGVSQTAAEAELTSLTRELARRQPHSFKEDERVQGHLLQESMLRSIQRFPAIGIFILMSLLVLLSACANLANMLLARGLARQREIDIRLAIGASRARIVRQLMTENLLLAVLGAGAGLACGTVFARVLLYALGAPPGFEVTTRWPILVAGLLLALLAAVAFGLPAALRTARPSYRKIRLRQGLVGVQVAVSCLLLIASGVLAHNGVLAASVDFAFDYRNMIVVSPQLAMSQEKLDDLSLRLSGLPGVEAITAAVVSPLGGRLRIENLPGLPHVYKNAVAPSYFRVMNLPFVLGRPFLPGEDAVIVSESAARVVWPNQDPVGKVWKLSGAERTVVGVVHDSGANLLADPDSVEAYLPIQGADVNNSALILHTRGDPAAIARLIPSTAAGINRAVAVSLMRSSRDKLLQTQRRMITLFGSIGAVATSLAAAGMFALVAFALAQRRRELGIRIAIGATPRHILGILVAQNARPMGIGALVGAIMAAALSRLVRSLIVLQNGGRVDLIGFAIGLGCFVLAAAVATLWPALRALRIDPSETLREE
jgi:putative ABC transport system permease protein